MQFKVHPLFFVLALVLTAFGQALAFIWTFAALLLHELGHAAAARVRGYVVKRMVLLPFGAMMSVEENFDRTSGVIIGLAGPVVNLITALMVLGLWWLFPACYSATFYFFYANLTLAVFNLLPVYPLDGSRVVLGLCKNKLKAVKGLQIAGICVSAAALALFIASAFFRINFSLGIIAVFLFYGAAFGTKDEMYASVLDSSVKNYLIGVERKNVKISENTPIARLYHHIGPTNETVFEIVTDRGEPIARLNEEQLKRVALRNKLSAPIGKAAADIKDLD